MDNGVSGVRWSSALAVAEHVFRLVTAEPTTLYLRGDDYGADLPAGRIALGRLRDLLLSSRTSLDTRDAVWRELIGRARTDRSTWVVVAVGMAMPGLRRCLRILRLSFGGDPADLASEITAGFLAALGEVDLTDRALCARLLRAAHKAGTRHLFAEAAFDEARWAAYHSRTPAPPWGHPDLVLASAVTAGVITVEEARLIGTTRLERMPVAEVAACWGEPANTVVQRRRRAEHRLAAAIVEDRCPVWTP